MTGFVNIDKAVGVSSAKVVSRVKFLSGTPCGHMGTLDPLASGVLPVGIGKASRLFDWFLDKQKAYVASFRFGATSDTLDAEGEITERTDRIPTAEELERAIPRFLGEIEQVPPRYSAKSVGGRRGYALARAGVAFSLPPKRVRVDSIRLLGSSAPDTFEFEIVCGGGTYIRSLARDLAEAVGSLGLMSALRRTRSGFFSAADAVPLDRLTADNLTAYLIPTDAVLPFPAYAPEGEARRHLLCGQAIPSALEAGNYKCYIDGGFYGIAAVEGGLCRIRTKLC